VIQEWYLAWLNHLPKKSLMRIFKGAFNHEQKAHGSLKTFAGQGIPGGGSRLKAAGNFPRIPENRSRCRLGFSGGIPLLVRKTVLIPVTMCAVISSACGNS
jgi:hypothetical protein